VSRPGPRWLSALLAAVLLCGTLTFGWSTAAAAVDGIPELVGTVTGEDGSPIPGALIVVERPDGTGQTSTFTGADGSYQFDWLPDGEYLVHFHGSGMIPLWYGGSEDRAAATSVLVAAPGTATASMVLQRVGVVTGTASQAGTPLASDSSVHLYVQRDGSWTWVATVGLDSDGSFTVRPESARPVKLLLEAPTASFSYWYGDAFAEHTSTPVPVVPGETRSGVDFDIPGEAQVSGRLHNLHQAPIGGHVRRFVLDHGQLVQLDEAPWWTAQFSSYTVDVPAGVPVTVRGGGSLPEGFTSTWLGDTTEAAAARLLTLDTGELRTGLDITLPGGRSISGRVTDRRGEGHPGVEVTAFDGATPVSRATTAADGAFRLEGLGQHATGPVTMRIAGPGIVTEWYDDAATQQDARQVQMSPDGEDETVGVVPVAFAPERQLTNLTPPRLEGVPVAGRTVRATPGTWSQDPQSTRLEWFCNGVALGLSGPVLDVPADRAGCALSARATATLPGWESAQAFSEPVVVSPPLAATTSPRVTGTPVAGSVLSATAPQWSTPVSSLAYQWLRNGSPISGATGASYRAGAGDVGRVLGVRVTANRTDTGESALATSAATPVVRARSGLLTSGVSRSGSAVVNARLLTPGSARPGGVLRIRRAGRQVAQYPVTTTPRQIAYGFRGGRGWHTVSIIYPGARTATPVSRNVRVYIH
jgi:hypothetical protein